MYFLNLLSSCALPLALRAGGIFNGRGLCKKYMFFGKEAYNGFYTPYGLNDKS